MALIFAAVFGGFFISYWDLHKRRKFVLGSKKVLEDMLAEAWGLVNQFYWEVGPPCFDDLEDFGHGITNLFCGLDDDSMNICWKTKENEVIALERELARMITEIREDIEIVVEAKAKVPELFETITPILSRLRAKVVEGVITAENGKIHVDLARAWFRRACQEIDSNRKCFVMIHVWLKDAGKELELALAFEK